MQFFNYHLSDSPDSTSCFPGLSPVDLELTPPRSPSQDTHFPDVFQRLWTSNEPTPPLLL